MSLRLLTVNLKSVPAQKRKELIMNLRARGHKCEKLIVDYSDIAELHIDGSGDMHFSDWDGIYSNYTLKYVTLTPWSYELLCNVLEGMEPVPTDLKSDRHCACKMTLEGILHEEGCHNWVDLRALHPWGILCSKKS